MFHAKVRAQTQLPLFRRWFGYKGKTVYLVEGETAHISDYWDGGCRSYPRMFSLVTMAQVSMEIELQSQGNPYGLTIGTVQLTPTIGLVEHVFSGTRQYLRVTLHPDTPKGEWI